jgi:hypothetical protein
VFADALVSRAGIGMHDNVLYVSCGIGDLLLKAGRTTDGMVFGLGISPPTVAIANYLIDHADPPENSRCRRVKVIKLDAFELNRRAINGLLNLTQNRGGLNLIFAIAIFRNVSKAEVVSILKNFHGLLAPKGRCFYHMPYHASNSPAFSFTSGCTRWDRTLAEGNKPRECVGRFSGLMRLGPPQALAKADCVVRRHIEEGLGGRCRILNPYDQESLFHGRDPHRRRYIS